MSITDELRDWTLIHTVSCSDNRIALVAIAERIDAALEGYIELPKDADGQTIGIGDTLEGYGKTIEIEELRNDGTWHLVDVYGIEWDCHEAFAHAKPDSWERIIEDAAKTIHPNGAFNPFWREVRDALVERCKRLAGEGA